MGSSNATLSRLEDCDGGNIKCGVVGLNREAFVGGVWASDSVTVFDRDRSAIGVGIDTAGRVRCCGSGEYCCCGEGKSEKRRGGCG